jgi:FkbM family methyltransferase
VSITALDDIDALPFTAEEKLRIRIALECHDCDAIPKVADAGQVHDSPHGRYQIMHNGLKIAEHSYQGPWMTELIRRLRGHHEPQEEMAFHEVMKHVSPRSTMVELGCYWSYYALWFSRCAPEARLLLLEPVRENLEAGRRNLELNGVTGSFVQALVGERSDGGTSMVGQDRIVRPVPTLSVDDLVARHGGARVELLLVDVQGAELDALKGALGLIVRGGLRFVFVSTHHHLISHDPLMHQRCVRFLEDHGAHIIARHNVVESFSGDGLIVASFDPADRELSIPLSMNWPTNSTWRELEYDLDDAWRTLGLGVAARRRALHSLAQTAYRVPALLPALYSAYDHWNQLSAKRRARRSESRR